MRAIAAQAQIPLSTIHYVFPTKDAIVAAIVDDLAAEISDALVQPATDDDTFGASVRAAAASFWSVLVEGRRDLQLMQYDLTVYSIRSPTLSAVPAHQYRAYVQAVSRWCTTAAARTGATLMIDPEMLARMIVALADGLILQYVSDPDDNRSRRDLDTALMLLLTDATSEGP